MSHSQRLMRTSLTLASLLCTLDGWSSRSHSQLRQGGRGLQGAGHSPHSFHHTGQTISAPGHTRPGSGYWGVIQQDGSTEVLLLQHIVSPAIYKPWLSYRQLSWNAPGVAFMSLNGKPEAQQESG